MIALKVARTSFHWFLTARNFVRIEKKADQAHCNIFVNLDYIIYTLPKTAVTLSSAITVETFQKDFPDLIFRLCH